MKAFAIVMKNHEISEKGFQNLIESSQKVKNQFEIHKWDAITPPDVDEYLSQYKIEWTWPWSGKKFCEKTKIRMHPYGTRNPKRRIACFLSHYLLWKRSVDSNEDLLILEHDAIFINRLDWNTLEEKIKDYGVIGLNDPRGATRLAQKFYAIIDKNPNEIQPVPTIDRLETAQGIAGNSAYIIKPWAAKEVIEKVDEIGAWPNDATICQQIFPWIGVTKKYYTKVQGLKSTTSTDA